MNPDNFDLAAFKKPARPPKPAEPAAAAQQAPEASPVLETTESPARPSEAAQEAPQDVQAPPTEREASRGEGEVNPPRRRRAPRAAGPESDGRLVVALPIALRDRARAVAASHGETYAEVVLRAIQETHTRLPELVAKHHGGDGPTIGSLFEHRAKPKRVVEATAQVTIRGLSSHDRSVLDQLVDDVGAANLTELVTVALDEHLPARPRAMR